MTDIREDFPFRGMEAGPRRDAARAFHELVLELNWLQDGEKKEIFLAKLKEAREAALSVAEDMLRPT